MRLTGLSSPDCVDFWAIFLGDANGNGTGGGGKCFKADAEFVTDRAFESSEEEVGRFREETR